MLDHILTPTALEQSNREHHTRVFRGNRKSLREKSNRKRRARILAQRQTPYPPQQLQAQMQAHHQTPIAPQQPQAEMQAHQAPFPQHQAQMQLHQTPRPSIKTEQ